MKPIDKYKALIRKGRFTESELIYFRKAINGSSKMDVDFRIHLVNAFNDKAESKGIQLEESQQVKGYLWLKDKCYKRNGTLRKSPVLAGTFERDILENYSHFTCSGLFQASDNAYANYVPIYRMYAKDGRWFEYACNMGQITIIGIGKGKLMTHGHRWPGFNEARGIAC